MKIKLALFNWPFLGPRIARIEAEAKTNKEGGGAKQKVERETRRPPLPRWYLHGASFSLSQSNPTSLRSATWPPSDPRPRPPVATAPALPHYTRRLRFHGFPVAAYFRRRAFVSAATCLPPFALLRRLAVVIPRSRASVAFPMATRLAYACSGGVSTASQAASEPKAEGRAECSPAGRRVRPN